MPFIAKIKDKEKNKDGSVRIVALITDNDKIEKQMVFNVTLPSQNLTWLKDNLRNEITNIQNIDPNILSLSNGPIDLS